MRVLRKTSGIPSRVAGPFESLLAQFSAATLELTPSLSTRQFARRLADRASEMFGARTAIVALRRNSEWEIGAISGAARDSGGAAGIRLAAVLGEQDSAMGARVRCAPARRLLGSELAGTLGWEKACVAPLIDSGGSLLAVLCLGNLAREMSATEEQLLEALASHASVAMENAQLFHRVEQSRKQWVEDFDAISDFIVVHDAANRVLRLNRPLADYLRMPLTTAIGRPMCELRIPGAATQPGGCPFCDGSQNAAQRESVHQAADRTYLVSTSLIREPHEGGARAIHVLKDITDRLDAERRYRRERDFNRNILNNTLSMILLLDSAGIVRYANRRAVEAGYREEDLLGRPLADLVPPGHRPVLVQGLERALRGVAVDKIEVPLNGESRTRQFSVSLSPIRDDDGGATSIVAVMTDITDAADLQAKLMQTEKMAALGQLVSGVAHEVNNPLAAIVGFTDLLLENPEVPESAKEDLRVILEQSQRTRLIVHNLLSFARQTPPHREPLQVNAVLRQTLQLRAYDLSSHGVEVVERYDDDLPVVLGDPHQLQQVFLNIVNNAYDAVREGPRPGRIEITTSRRSGSLEITFRDNGPGISRPERIFDPFFTTKEVGKGTGLGLSICYGIIRSHQGEILARNNDEGVGCTFTIHLPVSSGAAEPAFVESPR